MNEPNGTITYDPDSGLASFQLKGRTYRYPKLILATDDEETPEEIIDWAADLLVQAELDDMFE